MNIIFLREMCISHLQSVYACSVFYFKGKEHNDEFSRLIAEVKSRWKTSKRVQIEQEDKGGDGKKEYSSGILLYITLRCIHLADAFIQNVGCP